MTHNRLVLNKANFIKNMGILGLEGVSFFSERIYNLIDQTQKGSVRFQ